MITKRQLNFAAAFICVGLMAYALYAQYQLLLEPCPLCIFQRVAVIVMGIVFLLAAVHSPGVTGSRVYAVLLLLAGGGGIFVSGRHVWLQNLPADKVPSCGPGLDFMLEAFPLMETLKMVLSGSGECASVDWSFLGLSMPAWVLIAVAALTLAGLTNNLRR